MTKNVLYCGDNLEILATMEKESVDLIYIDPPLLEKKYLKTIINCHECAETLGKADLDRDGKITVLDIDFILHQV
jgi:DNA modification methylase